MYYEYIRENVFDYIGGNIMEESSAKKSKREKIKELVSKMKEKIKSKRKNKPEPKEQNKREDDTTPASRSLSEDEIRENKRLLTALLNDLIVASATLKSSGEQEGVHYGTILYRDASQVDYIDPEKNRRFDIINTRVALREFFTAFVNEDQSTGWRFRKFQRSFMNLKRY